MCGITGILGGPHADAETVTRMTRALAHRGPDDKGEVLQEATCPTTVEGIDQQIKWLKKRRAARVGLEATTSATLARGLRSKGYSIDLYETRRLSKFLRIRRNKTDAGDAIGIAEAGRVGASVVPKVHMKSLECQTLQSRLAIRRQIIRERVASISLLCRQVELYGGRIRKSKKSMQLREQVEAEFKRVFGKSSQIRSDLHDLLDHCEQLLARQRDIDRDLGRTCRDHPVASRFLEVPGVGPICALTFYAAIGEPDRFERSSDVGSYFGLAPRLHQSGLVFWLGRISKRGNRAARTALVQAATAFMRYSDEQCGLRAWTERIERERGRGRARVALARKLSIIMLTMWKKDQSFAPMPIAAE